MIAELKHGDTVIYFRKNKVNEGKVKLIYVVLINKQLK